MKTYIHILVVAFILQACNAPERENNTTDTIEIVGRIDVHRDTTSSIFKGLYTLGNEVNIFQDCDGREKLYWVNDSTVNLGERYEKTNRFPSYPYESVYAEVRGYLSGKSKLGYASEYENVLVVTEIIKVEPKNFRTECYNYEFIAVGNEPFWSVDIIPNERRIVFKDVGQEKALEFIYAPARVTAGAHRYEATSPGNGKLVVVIREERCSDGMSDRQYNYSAEVTVNGTVYKGCAIKKSDKFDE